MSYCYQTLLYLTTLLLRSLEWKCNGCDICIRAALRETTGMYKYAINQVCFVILGLPFILGGFKYTSTWYIIFVADLLAR